MILVDFNAIAVSESMALLARDGNPNKTEVVTIIINKIHDLATRFQPSYGAAIICFEGKGNWRKALYKEYKKNRKKEKKKSDIDWEFLYSCFAEAEEIIDLHTAWLRMNVDLCEADDVIAVLSKALGGSHMIVSRDSDFYALHSVAVKQWDFVTKKQMKLKGDVAVWKHERYKRGSSKENIANCRMPMNFLSEMEGRQKPITQKWLDAGLMSEYEATRYTENKHIMDFDLIPEDVQDSIKEKYKTMMTFGPLSKTKSAIWLAQNGYRALARKMI